MQSALEVPANITMADVVGLFGVPAAAVDGDGGLVAWNDGWAALVEAGDVPAAAVGERLADLVAPPDEAEAPLTVGTVAGRLLAEAAREGEGAAGQEFRATTECSIGLRDVCVRRMHGGMYVVRVTVPEHQDRALEQIEASTERFSRVFAAAPVGVVVVELAGGTIIDVNGAFLSICGHERDEVIGKTTVEIGLWVEHSERIAIHQELMARGRVSDTEISYHRGDGNVGRALTSWELTEIMGQPCAVTTAIDITERVRAEAELRASEERYRLLADNAGDIIVRLSIEGEVLYVSPAVSRILGRLPELVVGDDVIDGADPADAELTRAAFRRAAMVESVTFEARQRHADGRLIWLETHVWPMFDPETGDVVELHALARDISERKRSQEKLAKSEERFRALVQHSSDITTIVDLAGVILYASPSVFDWLGYRPEEVLGQNILSFVHPEDLPAVGAAFANTVQVGGIHQPLELRGRHASGRYRVISTVANNLVDNPAVRGIVHHSRDVTEAVELRRQREEAVEQLRRAHRETRRLLASVPAVLVAVDKDEIVTLWNGAAEATFGWTGDEMVGRKLDPLRLSPEPQDIAEALRECAASRMPQHRELMRFHRADGTDGLMGIVVSPMASDEQELSGMLIAAVDVTEQVQLHERLSQAQRLESLGQIAAGVAHEINTPMQFIGDNLHFLQDAFAELEVAEATTDTSYLRREVPLALDHSLEGVRRVVRIVQAMKELAHPGAVEMAPCDLNEALETAITMTMNEWKYVARVERDLDPDLPEVDGYASDLSQAFVNIIVNAAHAIADNMHERNGQPGTIQVSTRALRGSVEVRIGDTGGGIAEGIQKRIFDPFFTTKGVGRGTGQGLAIAHTVVVHKHQGDIRFETAPGQGTTFVITLPMRSDDTMEDNR